MSHVGNQGQQGINHHSNLINELEKNEVSVSTILAKLYETRQGLDSEGTEAAIDSFLQEIDRRIQIHTNVLEEQCFSSREAFVSAAKHVNPQTFLSDIRQIHATLVESRRIENEGFSTLIELGDKIGELQRSQRNINETTLQLSICLPVLKAASSLQNLIENKEYYKALKTYESIERELLPLLKDDSFSRLLQASLLKKKERIKDETLLEVKHFLVSLLNKSARIGELTMSQVLHNNSTNSTITSAPLLLGDPFETPRADSKRQPLSHTATGSNNEATHVDSFTQLIDLAGFYRCVHIFTTLNELGAFAAQYKEDRLHQLDKFVAHDPSINLANKVGLLTYLNRILGYFVVEQHIGATTPTCNLQIDSQSSRVISRGLSFSSDITDARAHWIRAESGLVFTLRSQVEGKYTSPDIFIELKECVQDFCTVMECYGFDTRHLRNFLIDISGNYIKLLVAKWTLSLYTVLLRDNFTPIRVASQDEVSLWIKKCPLPCWQSASTQLASGDKSPVQLPFSYSVPNLYISMKEFVNSAQRYAQSIFISTSTIGLRLSTSPQTADTYLRKATNQMLKLSFINALKAMVQGKTIPGATQKSVSRGFNELVQMICNMQHLEQAVSVCLVKYISNISGSPQPTIPLQVESTFLDAVSDIQCKLIEIVWEKIEGLMENAQYDWTFRQSRNSPLDTGVSCTEPSPYLEEVLPFINNILMQSAASLPVTVAQAIAMEVFKCIASCLSRLLHAPSSTVSSLGDANATTPTSSPSTAAVNHDLSPYALRQLRVDVLAFEALADSSSSPIPDPDRNFPLAFAELKQLLNLFVLEDFSSFIQDYGLASTQYPRLGVHRVIGIMERLLEYERKAKGTLSKFREDRADRDRREWRRAVLKQLKRISTSSDF